MTHSITSKAARGGRSPENRTSRKAFVKSFGCQMNVYDSQRMADLAAMEGYGAAAAPEEAELVVINTCYIREKASEKVFSELGKLRELKEERQRAGLRMTIVVAGCVAQAEGKDIFHRQPAVDVVVGPQSYHRLPELLRDAEARSGVIDTEFPVMDKFESLPQSPAEAVKKRGAAAFVTVQEGCDKFCSFCVVPYTRGAEASRPSTAVVDEVRRLADNGVREVTLIGQNVNAYRGLDARGRPTRLAELIGKVGEVEGIARVRYATSHPNDMTDDLISAHKDIQSLAPYLHLPIQSGSDTILSSMNRRHTVEAYLDIIARARAARPDIAFSSDLIVGYPGEKDEDFEATVALVRAVRFASAFAFKYSLRPGTPAADSPNQLEDDVKVQRLARLQAVIDDERRAFNAACVGKKFKVLFEKVGRHPKQAVGRSPYMQSVVVEGAASLLGSIVEVEIFGAGPNSLRGRLVSSAS